MRQLVAILALLLISYGTVWSASGTSSSAGNDIVSVLLALAVIMVGAKLGGSLAQALGQPTVIGELVCGVLLGNTALIGLGWFDSYPQLHTIHVLAEIGVIILLFQVGLESDLGRMMHVGLSSLLVAILGVIGPFLLGWGVGIWFYPEASIYTHVFLGAILTATSVGITARVLKDINRLDSDEARIILGAAVIDDVLGLLILAVVSGVIQAADGGVTMSSGAIFWLIAKAVAFLLGSLLIGRLVYQRMFRIASYLRVHGMLLILALALCFALAILAAKVGLAPLVGAFAAGLILEEVEFTQAGGFDKHRLEELLEPLALFLVPVFFVKMGMAVDLSTFANIRVLLFAIVLTIAAIVGKQLSAFGVVRSGKRNVNRWIVGVGMVPRGEVGLIFAGIGLSLSYQEESVVSAELYAVVVIMVVVTTLVTPPVLNWSFRRLPK